MLIYNGEFGKSDTEEKKEDNGESVAIEIAKRLAQKNGGEAERERILNHYRRRGQ